MNYILGVDIGTQGNKGILLNERLEAVAQTYMEHDYYQPCPNWYEHDAEKIWWNGFKQTVRQLLSQVDFPSDKIIGVGCSGLAPCFLPTDKDNRPLRNAILYGIDIRSAEEVKEIVSILGEDEVLRINKQPITTQTVGPKMLWFKKNEPELFARTVRFFTTTNYIIFKLTGEYILDDTQASLFGPFYDFNTSSWDREMCRFFQIPYEWFPPVIKPIDIAGKISARAAEETGLAQGTPVIACTGDAIAEVFSAGASEKGEVTLIYGTTGMIIISVDNCAPTKTLWLVPHPIFENEFLVAGGTATTAGLTKWYRNNFGAVEQVMQERINVNAYDLLLEQAAKVPAGSEGLLVLPYFSGERTPIHDPLARGLILGLTLSHTRAHVYRSLLEGTAYSFQHHFDIFKQRDYPVTRVVACGGGTKGDLWPQIVSDVIGYDQFIPDTYMGAEVGSAFFAAMAAGLVKDVKAIKACIERKNCKQIMFDPDNHKIYQKYFKIYQNAYLNNKEDMHHLAKLAVRPADDVE